MLVEAANRLCLKTVILDQENSPAKQINSTQDHLTGSFANSDDIRKLAVKCDILTTEIEHVDTAVLKELDGTAIGISGDRLVICPSPDTIAVIKDKYLQKRHLINGGIAVAEMCLIENSEASFAEAGRNFGYPFMVKSRTQAYDGRGNFVVHTESEISQILPKCVGRPLYAEKWAKFSKELAVMVVKNRDGSIRSYPTVETVHKNNICHIVYAPARVPEHIQRQAQKLAVSAVETFLGCGIFGVEMFLLDEGLVINEIAPRPHNSGHYTIEACNTSQYEAHLRALLGIPLPQESVQMRTRDMHAIMVNILGGKLPDEYHEQAKRAMSIPGAQVHLYGKSGSVPERKMGHFTITGGSMEECEKKLSFFQDHSSASYAEYLGKRALSLQGEESSTGAAAIVGIIMGSDSDLPTMKPAAAILRKFGIPFELTIVSAHRTPARMVEYAHNAAKRGIRVIIAAAGGAAHLPGMTASETALPVIGVPIRASVLDGLDSLLSIVQMPRGIPCATVGINNSTNAALLAIRILGSSDPHIQAQIETHATDMENEVLQKIEKLDSVGWEDY